MRRAISARIVPGTVSLARGGTDIQGFQVLLAEVGRLAKQAVLVPECVAGRHVGNDAGGEQRYRPASETYIETASHSQQQYHGGQQADQHNGLVAYQEVAGQGDADDAKGTPVPAILNHRGDAPDGPHGRAQVEGFGITVHRIFDQPRMQGDEQAGDQCHRVAIEAACQQVNGHDQQQARQQR